MTTHKYTAVPYSEIDVHIGDLNDDFIRILRTPASDTAGADTVSESGDRGLYIEFPSCTLRKSSVLNDKTKKLQLQFDMENVEFLQFLRKLKERVIKQLVENWEEIFGEGEDIGDESEKYETIRETFEDTFTLRRNRSLVQMPVQCNLNSKSKFRDNYKLQIVNGRDEALPYSESEVSEMTPFTPIICVRGVRINHEVLNEAEEGDPEKDNEGDQEDDVVIASMQLEFFLNRIRIDAQSQSAVETLQSSKNDIVVADSNLDEIEEVIDDPIADVADARLEEEDRTVSENEEVDIDNEANSIEGGEVDLDADDDVGVDETFQINPSRSVFEEGIKLFRRTLNKKRIEYLKKWMRSRNITNENHLMNVDYFEEERGESESESDDDEGEGTAQERVVAKE